MNVEYGEFDTFDEDSLFAVVCHNEDGSWRYEAEFITGWSGAHRQACKDVLDDVWVSIYSTDGDKIDTCIWNIDLNTLDEEADDEGIDVMYEYVLHFSPELANADKSQAIKDYHFGSNVNA